MSAPGTGGAQLTTNGEPDTPGLIFVLPWGFSLGGVEVWATSLGPHLAERCPLKYLCYPPPFGATPAEYALPPSATVVPLATENWGGVSRSNLDAYRQALPAVVIPNNSTEAYAAAAVLSTTHATELRVIGYYHGFSPEVRANLVRYERIIHRFVAVSDECAADLRYHLPGRAGDICTRPYGVRVPRTLERSPPCASTPLRLFYAGRLFEQQKRLLDLVRVAEHLTSQQVKFQLRIVGDGPNRTDLLAALAGSPARASVHVDPPIPTTAVPAALREADVAVMTSAYEGTSVFLLEAMAHGCVPVVTSVSGTARLIDPGRTGFLASVGDTKRLAESIAALANDRALLARLGAAAHAAIRPYSLELYAEWFETLLTEVWVEPDRRWPSDRPLFPLGARVAHGVGQALPLVRRAWRRLRRSRDR